MNGEQNLKTFFRRHVPSLFRCLSALWWSFRDWLQREMEKRIPAKALEFMVQELAAVPVRGDGGRPQKILFFTMRGWDYHVLFEVLLALRLRQRGHDIVFVDCDGELPFCNNGNTWSQDPAPCAYCLKRKNLLYRHWLPHRALGPCSREAQECMRALDSLDVAGCCRVEWKALPVGRLCLDTARWFLCRAQLTPEDLPLVRQVVWTGIHVADRLPALFDELVPDRVVLLNGEFAPERTAVALCQQRGIPCLIHEAGVLPKTFYMRTSSSKPYWVNDTFEPLRTRQLTPRQRQRIVDLFETAKSGPPLYWKGILSDAGMVRAELKLDTRPIAVAFSNVTWDTAVLGRDILFHTMFDWLTQLVEFFRKHPEWQLVVRAHPAESTLDGAVSKEPVVDYLRAHICAIPENVRLVDSKSKLSSYVLMDFCRCGLVYTSTTGMELAYAGKPVILPADTHYRSKGFTIEPVSQERYFQSLADVMANEIVPAGPPDALLNYAYHFYFERMIEFEPIRINQATRVISARDGVVRSFVQGKCPGVESFCDAIIEARSAVRGGDSSK